MADSTTLLAISKSMDCLFCKIVAHEISADVVYEDERVLGILDIHPVAPGHVMVIPKVHSENLTDLPDAEVGPVFMAVKTVLGKLKSALSPDGFTIGINHGKVSGQVIDHLHIHLIPRFNGDGGQSIHSVVSNPPKESLAEIKKRISG